MAAAKILSDNQRSYYRALLSVIVESMEVGKQYYTHYFETIQGVGYTFTNDRPLLRKVLRTLEADGKIKNINLGFNCHKWELVA